MLTRASSLSAAMPASGLRSAVNEDLDTAPMMGCGSDTSPMMGCSSIGGLGRMSEACAATLGSGHGREGMAQGSKRPPADAVTSMILLRERMELAAERLARQVGVLHTAKMEAFGYVTDLEELDASSFEETVNGRLGLVEYQLDRLENVVVTFGTTH